MKRHNLGEKSHGKGSLANFFLESKSFWEIGGNASLYQGGMAAPDSTYYSNLLISCSILPNQSIFKSKHVQV